MRVLALDLGKRRIGIAMSDPMRIIAQGYETIQRTTIREDLALLENMIRDKEVSQIVVGNPLHMSGRAGRGSDWARDFANRLAERTSLPVELWDERMTSVEAGRVLRSSGISIEKRAQAVDRLSAVLILENWLSAHV